MIYERLEYLYKQYIDGNASMEELQELNSMLNLSEDGKEFSKLLDQTWNELPVEQLKDIPDNKAADICASIIKNKQHKRSIGYSWLRVAASTLFFCVAGTALFVIFHSKNKTPQFSVQPIKSEPAAIMPGSNKAILTLGNGSKVVLDDHASGQIADQQGVKVKKVEDGQLVYLASNAKNGNAATVQYNTISIPKGGQYHLVLPDGTHVYLNSESELTYPISFYGDKRSVSLTGEAYFEVSKNPKMPFDLNVNGKQKIEVLGTHFNVEAYADENVVKTTLLEGSVKIDCQNKKAILKPGQIAINNPAKSLLIKEADIDEVMAWKNGAFMFDDDNIATIMKEISRWYDVDVVFKGHMEKINFTGNYARTKSLANLLKNIELIEKIHFVTEGRRITVIAR